MWKLTTIETLTKAHKLDRKSGVRPRDARSHSAFYGDSLPKIASRVIRAI